VSGNVLAFSFPNPFNLVGALLSPLIDLGKDVLGSIVEIVIKGLASAVLGALADLTASILSFFWDAAEPELTSSWFYGQDAPYQQMVLMAMPLLVAFFLAGVIQGVLRGDTAGMLRMALLRLPGSVLAMTVAVVWADMLLNVTHEMSAALLSDFRDDIEQVANVLVAMRVLGAVPALLLLLIFGAVGLLAAVVVIVELFVRAALLYLIAAFSPLIYAAAVWEPMRASVRKLGEIAFALILSKVAIAVALAVSSAALTATWPGAGATTSIPTPELTAAQTEQSVAQTVGILLSAIIMFVVAAFMPFVLWRLLPLAEGALVASGVRGGPLRAAHTAASAATVALHNPATAAVRMRIGREGVGQDGSSRPGRSGSSGRGAANRPTGSRGQGRRPAGSSTGRSSVRKPAGAASASRRRDPSEPPPIDDAWRRYEAEGTASAADERAWSRPTPADKPRPKESPTSKARPKEDPR
jgi:type IV secretion system protein TrbL